MPQTRSQLKLLSEILYAEDSSEATSDQAIANSTTSLDSFSTYQPESSSESSKVASVPSPPDPTVLTLERYKRNQDREEPPPTPKRVRFEPPQVSPFNRHSTTSESASEFVNSYKTPEGYPSTFTREEDYPALPKFADLLHLKPELSQGLEKGYTRNLGCGPSGYRLTLGTQLIAEIEDIDFRRSKLLEELGRLEQDKRRKLLNIEGIFASQVEELKISTISELERQLELGISDTKSINTFDKFGVEIQAHDLVEVDNPFTCYIEEGTIKQVLPNNVALIRLSETEQIIGLFGHQIKSLE